MKKDRQKLLLGLVSRLPGIQDRLDMLRHNETTYFKSIPENHLQPSFRLGSARAAVDDAISELKTACDALDDAVHSLSEVLTDA